MFRYCCVCLSFGISVSKSAGGYGIANCVTEKPAETQTRHAHTGKGKLFHPNKTSAIASNGKLTQ